MAFMNEVAEQALRLREICANDRLLDNLAPLDKKAFDLVVFTGMGSSYAAGYLAAMRLSQLGVRSLCMEPDLLQHSFSSLLGDSTLVVAISQSGNSPETVRLAQTVPASRLIAIINNENGALGKLTDYRVLLQAGTEQHTSSKTYTNSIAAAYRVAEWFAGCPSSVLDESAALCDTMQNLLNNITPLGERMADFFTDAKEIITIGAGTSFATVFQADYVLAEMDQVFTKYITPAEFFHGMIESADETYNVILCDGDPAFSGRMDEVLSIFRKRGSKCLVLTPRTDLIGDERTLVLPLSVPNAYLFPIADIIFIETLGFSLAMQRGLHPGELSYVRK